MNYYERHLGDYARDTAHLSMMEHGAYTLLLDRYYATEQAIPADQAHRLARARTREEKAAVDAVLSEFFTLDNGMWRKGRIDDEITKFLDGEPEREVKKANESNRLKRHREERSELFRALTNAGQHAPWNINITELREMVKRLPVTASQPAPETPPATAPATPATATQTPDTRHQTKTSLSPAHDDRLDDPGLSDYHRTDWQPDLRQLEALLAKSGCAMPDDTKLADSLNRFNLNYSGRALTSGETYSRLVRWISEDVQREKSRQARVGNTEPRQSGFERGDANLDGWSARRQDDRAPGDVFVG